MARGLHVTWYADVADFEGRDMAILRAIGRVAGPGGVAIVYRDTTWTQFRVRLVGELPATAYHTDSRVEAFDTARAMVAPESVEAGE